MGTTTSVRHTEKRTLKRASDHYRKGNLESARAILENIAKYGGEDAALVEWARLTLHKAEPTITGPLLRERAA